MVMAVMFWVLILLLIVVGGWGWHQGPQSPAWVPWGGNLIFLLLLVILGLRVFGSPLSG